jgi:hypothetical protein
LKCDSKCDSKLGLQIPNSTGCDSNCDSNLGLRIPNSTGCDSRGDSNGVPASKLKGKQEVCRAVRVVVERVAIGQELVEITNRTDN